jgi:hypothetical protein
MPQAQLYTPPCGFGKSLRNCWLPLSFVKPTSVEWTPTTTILVTFPPESTRTKKLSDESQPKASDAIVPHSSLESTLGRPGDDGADELQPGMTQPLGWLASRSESAGARAVTHSVGFVALAKNRIRTAG